MNKASGGGIPVELFQILKDDAVKVLHSVGQQIWKTQQWPQDQKNSVFIPIPKKGNAKECLNYCTIALISHTSKVMFKILQARLQQYMNCEFQMFILVLEKAEEPEIKLPTSAGSWKKQKSSRKTSISLLTVPKPLTMDHNKLENSERDGNTRPPDLPLEKPICRSGSNSENWTWNNRLVSIGKGVHQGCILSLCLFNFHAEYIMRNSGLEETQAEIKLAGRNINNLRYADDTTFMAESEEELKSLLMKVKVESETLD